MASSTASNDPLSGKTKMLMSLIKYNQPGYAVKHWAAIAAKNGMSVAKVKQHFAKVRNEHLKATQDGPPPAPVESLDDRDNQSPVAAANEGDDANDDEDLVAPPVGATRAAPPARPARTTRPARHASPARHVPVTRPTRASRVAGSASAGSAALTTPNAPNASSARSLRNDRTRSSQIQRIQQGQRGAAYGSNTKDQEKAGPALPRHWQHSNALGLKRPSDLGRDEEDSGAKKAKTSSVFDNHTHEEVRQMFDQEIAKEEARQGIVWDDDTDSYIPSSSQPSI
ncbi:hypothetical protein PG987_015590 [Apiospora arundinis]